MSPLYLYKGKLLTSNDKLAIDKNCCCEKCKQCYCFCGLGIGSPGDLAHAKTYTVPDQFQLPVKVTIVGGVDDVWVLDGDGTVDNQDPRPNQGTPAHEFDYSWTQAERSFTIEALDTYGVNLAINYILCIMPLNTDPSEECSPIIDASNDNSCENSINSCASTGACCDYQSTRPDPNNPEEIVLIYNCFDGYTEADCEGGYPPGTFYPGKTCIELTDDCQHGACCRNYGRCDDRITRSSCESTFNGGEFYPGQDCSNINCL